MLKNIKKLYTHYLKKVVIVKKCDRFIQGLTRGSSKTRKGYKVYLMWELLALSAIGKIKIYINKNNELKPG